MAFQGEHSKRRSATKKGPGRYHGAGEPGNRLTKQRPQRAYVALMAAWAAKRVTKAKHRDHEGRAYTLVGRYPRRMWVAGISAQRGY